MGSCWWGLSWVWGCWQHWQLWLIGLSCTSASMLDRSWGSRYRVIIGLLNKISFDTSWGLRWKRWNCERECINTYKLWYNSVSSLSYHAQPSLRTDNKKVVKKSRDLIFHENEDGFGVDFTQTLTVTEKHLHMDGSTMTKSKSHIFYKKGHIPQFT